MNDHVHPIFQEALKAIEPPPAEPTPDTCPNCGEFLEFKLVEIDGSLAIQPWYCPECGVKGADTYKDPERVIDED